MTNEISVALFLLAGIAVFVILIMMGYTDKKNQVLSELGIVELYRYIPYIDDYICTDDEERFDTYCGKDYLQDEKKLDLAYEKIKAKEEKARYLEDYAYNSPSLQDGLLYSEYIRQRLCDATRYAYAYRVRIDFMSTTTFERAHRVIEISRNDIVRCKADPGLLDRMYWPS